MKGVFIKGQALWHSQYQCGREFWLSCWVFLSPLLNHWIKPTLQHALTFRWMHRGQLSGRYLVRTCLHMQTEGINLLYIGVLQSAHQCWRHTYDFFLNSSFYKNICKKKKKNLEQRKPSKCCCFPFWIILLLYLCWHRVFLCMATSIVQDNNAAGKVVMSLFGLNVTDAGSLMGSLWSLRHDLSPTKLVSISQLLCTLLLYSK